MFNDRLPLFPLQPTNVSGSTNGRENGYTADQHDVGDKGLHVPESKESY